MQRTYTRRDYIEGISDGDGEVKLILMEYMGDEVYFAWDEEWAKLAPPGSIIYTLSEMEKLRGASDYVKIMVHEAKKRGAKLIEVKPIAPREVAEAKAPEERVEEKSERSREEGFAEGESFLATAKRIMAEMRGRYEGDR